MLRLRQKAVKYVAAPSKGRQVCCDSVATIPRTPLMVRIPQERKG